MFCDRNFLIKENILDVFAYSGVWRALNTLHTKESKNVAFEMSQTMLVHFHAARQRNKKCHFQDIQNCVTAPLRHLVKCQGQEVVGAE